MRGEVQSRERGEGESEVKGEAVARAAGNERECGRRVDERLGDLVHGAVAADGDDALATGLHAVTGEDGGVTGAFGRVKFGVERLAANEVAQQRQQPGAARMPARDGVEDETDFHGNGANVGAVVFSREVLAAMRCRAIALAASLRTMGARALRHCSQTAPRSAKAWRRL